MNSIINNMNKHNNELSKYACSNDNAIRFKRSKDDVRPAFFKDADKILYSLAYSRYSDKTQVFSLTDNDMISTRMIHIQLVSKIARTIGRGLNLNEDLIEAASLGHDLGHTPFGHVGEKILDKISQNHGEGYFNHNVHSVRTLMDIENGGKGSNITVQVLDAILCHNGEELKQKYYPTIKTKEEFLENYKNTYKDRNALKGINSMTLEGCVVRISDVIAYIGKDVEDAIRLKKITKEDLPENVVKVLGTTNSHIVNTIVNDILKNSIDKDYIEMSDEIFNSLKELMDFNYKNIYEKANTKENLIKIEDMFNKLFDLYYNQIKNNEVDSDIYKYFLDDMSDEYLNETSISRKVIDFIAGMTDGYIINQYKMNFD